MPEDKVVSVDPPRKLLEKDFQLDEQFVYARACVTLPVGWAFEECLKPEFWVNIAPKFKKDQFTNGPEKTGAVVTIRTADHAFYAELYVRAVRERDLIVSIVKEPVYFGPKEVQSDKYETRWNVGKRSYDIIRKSDKEIVGEAKTKEGVVDWIAKTHGTVAKAA